ncbi:Hypothetical_protein [Hexamita inflata]|uniref:Hypothetical_protein n=1 Tax=Hexamita inflata TaxID=28002 RepID=A0AA86TEZ3_9EUKA|nr:Hypothetical protein HINF_LOCUS3480 [Hexamita inflata]
MSLNRKNTDQRVMTLFAQNLETRVAANKFISSPRQLPWFRQSLKMRQSPMFVLNKCINNSMQTIYKDQGYSQVEQTQKSHGIRYQVDPIILQYCIFTNGFIYIYNEYTRYYIQQT